MLRHHAGWGTCRGLPGAAHKTPGTGEVPTHRQRFNTRAGKGPSSSSHLCHRGDGGQAAELGWAPQIAVTLCWGVSTGTGAGSGYNKGVCRQVPVQDVGGCHVTLHAWPGSAWCSRGAVRCPVPIIQCCLCPLDGSRHRYPVAVVCGWCHCQYQCLVLRPVPLPVPLSLCPLPAVGAGSRCQSSVLVSVPCPWCWYLVSGAFCLVLAPDPGPGPGPCP